MSSECDIAATFVQMGCGACVGGRWLGPASWKGLVALREAGGVKHDELVGARDGLGLLQDLKD